MFCRAAIAALRRDGRPLDVLHVHDWHTGPALLERARADAARETFLAGTAVLATLHNLAYHGWTGLGSIGQLGLRPGEPLAGANPDGIDLLLTAIERSEIANTVSPGFAREALTKHGVDVAQVPMGEAFTKLVAVTGKAPWDVTQQLYAANNPAIVWYIMGVIGVATAISIAWYGAWAKKHAAAHTG